MWESFRAAATHWGIYREGSLVGFGLVNDHAQLIQFYLQDKHLPNRLEIFTALLEAAEIEVGFVGTHQPVFLSTALHFAKETTVHTYLFTLTQEQSVAEKEGDLTLCSTQDLEDATDFCHYSFGAPKKWLRAYLGSLIQQEALFKLTLGKKIIGTCEVRHSMALPDHADIGMIVSPDFRRQGYGTYLLGQAKTIAQQRGKKPICSCEAGNTGSLKAIYANGFRSRYQLLEIEFSHTPI